MSILEKLGPDTVSRLERAAEQRYQEACHLSERRFYLAAIYLSGYAAEMTIGSAYFRSVLGYGATEPFDRDRFTRLLTNSRQLSGLVDKSHPIDGLSRVLIRDEIILNPPAIDRKIAESLRFQVEVICKHWGPRLRYRAIQATPAESKDMLTAVRWIIDYCP